MLGSNKVKSISIVLSLLVLFPSANTMSCDLTDDYKTARNEIAKSAKESFYECVASVSKAQRWFAFAQCIEQRDDKKSGRTCSDIIGHNLKEYKKLSIDVAHCKVLSASSQEFKVILEEHVKEKGIIKCKTN